MKHLKKIISVLFVLTSTISFAQQVITLEDCYNLVTTNYPIIKQKVLLEEQNKLELEVIGTEKNPKIDVSAQASYQSDVIGIPIATITPPNKDQYKATVSVNQLIYAGGAIDASMKAKEAELETNQKQIEVNLYQLKKQVNQLYFSILLLQEKRNLLTAKEKQLLTKIKEVKSGIKNGVLIPSSDKILEAEILKVNQQFSEIDNNKKSLIATLSSLIGKKIADSSAFKNPEITSTLTSKINRPELELFELKKKQLDASEMVLSKQNAPKIMGFATGGYGNPGLNMLDNSFQGFYTVGVKLNWNVFDWNANKKKRESLLINKKIVDTEAEVFDLNTSIELNQQLSEIKKLEDFIVSDLEIIELRKDVLKSVASQLKNGVVTSSTYITELTNLYEDEINLSTHKTQLLLAKANYNTTKGN